MVDDRLYQGVNVQMSQRQVFIAYQEQIDVNLRNMIKQ